jgi:signal transduction histidine kinase
VTAIGQVDRRTRTVLDELSGVLAVVVQLALVDGHLDAARERAVLVADEERRFVRRELRDGVAPGLLRAVDALESRRLDGLPVARAELARRTVEVRDLARTLVPGALDAGDLNGALRELADRFSRRAVRITISAERLDVLDAAHQVAVYHLIAELVLLSRSFADGDPLDIAVDVVPDGVLVRVVCGPSWRGASESLVGRIRDLGGSIKPVEGGLELELPR